MRVPVNPQTNAPTGELGYEKAVDVTAGQRALADVVNKYADYAAQEQKKRQLFDVQKLVVDETNNIEQDFQDKTRVQPLGAPNFTQQVAGEYTTRHAQMVKQLQDQGYDKDAVNEYATRLGTIRAQYIARAIDFQEKSNFNKNISDISDMALSLSQYTSHNPDALLTALDEFKTAISNSTLSKDEQLQAYDKYKGDIIRGGRESYAVLHPEVVLSLYGQPGEITTTSPTNLPAGQTFDLPSYIQKNKGAEGTGKNPRSSAVGYYQFTDGTWKETYKEVYGNTGESDAQILAKRKDLGVATKLMEKHTSDNVQKLVAANLPVNDGTVYLAHFLGVDGAIKVLSAHADESISKLVDKKSIAANPNTFKKVKTAGDLISWASNTMGLKNIEAAAPALKPIPPGWKGNQEDAIQELGMTADQAAEFLRTGKDTRVAGQSNSSAVGQSASIAPQTLQNAGINVDAQGKTGIPAIDLSSGPERMQMLTIARTIMNEKESDAKAAQRQAHDQWYNNFLNGLQDGKLSQNDLNAAYANGQLSDFDERKKAQGILDEKNKKDQDLVNFGTLLNSGLKGNPYDKQTKDAVDAGFKAGIKDIVKNGKEISPFQYALHLWQRTGVMPTQATVMIRGALVSTDATQVLDAASVATNILRENPNAFAGTDGQADIEHAAVNFGHYVYDFGMSPQEAAARVAQENDPKFKEKFKYSDPIAKQNITTLRQNGVNAAQVLGGKFANIDAAGEANQTYFEEVNEQLNRGVDLQTAMVQAKTQLQKVYGTNARGIIVKYPPERMYPQINSSWNYIYEDAQKTVKDETGRDPIHVNLAPIPGVTDQDFRSGQPPRYRIIYTFKAKDGQVVTDSVPGQFAADISLASKKAAIQNQNDFVKERARQLQLQSRTQPQLLSEALPGKL